MKPLLSRTQVGFLAATLVAAALAGCADDKSPKATFVTPHYGDPCQYFDCSGQGECVPSAAGPMCQCVTGFAGAHCTVCDIGFHRDANDRCVPDKRCADQPDNPCGIHGQCQDADGVIACACEMGYEGARCTLCAPGYGNDEAGDCLQQVLSDGRLTLVPAACSEDACHEHGQCSDKSGAIECDCYPGYIGGRCESCANDYTKAAASDRCIPTGSCDASACGSCTLFDGDPDFPNYPDTCVSKSELQLDEMTIWSEGGEGELWLCAPSTRYELGTEHVALVAGALRPAEITFSAPAARLSFDYVAWDTASLALLGDGRELQKLSVESNRKGSISLEFDPAIFVLGFRSGDEQSHTLAIDDLVYEGAACE